MVYHLFDLHASLELDPLRVHHHVDLPGSVLKSSPANEANLSTEIKEAGKNVIRYRHLLKIKLNFL
jgi:hypothetical protein